MKKFYPLRTVLLLIILVSLNTSSGVAQDASPSYTLFTNVNIFDGSNESLVMNTDVLVENNMVKQVSKNIKAPDGTEVIDGGGRTLMPGLADTHTHIAFGSNPLAQVLGGDAGYNYIHSTVDANTYLMNGVTSIRDMGGDSFGLKKAIDEGIVPGPRIYPAGPMISQTGGHGDFRFANQKNPLQGAPLPPVYDQGHAVLADGVPAVLTAARENLRKGASHIKIAAGGGYSSPADPLLGDQYTFDEIKAAVDAATFWGTYVTIHSYHPSAINRAIDAGVKDIGHGQLLDEATMRKMAEKGVFLSTQPFTLCSEPHLDDFSNQKLGEVCKGTEFVYKTAKKIPNLKLTYGTDLFFVPAEMLAESVKMMERLLPWYNPYEILKMATGNAGDLFAMSGLRNPYPNGTLGVVKEGAYADLLIVNGNPLDDIKMVTDNTNIRIIMKDGKIYKNTLD